VLQGEEDRREEKAAVSEGGCRERGLMQRLELALFLPFRTEQESCVSMYAQIW